MMLDQALLLDHLDWLVVGGSCLLLMLMHFILLAARILSGHCGSIGHLSCSSSTGGQCRIPALRGDPSSTGLVICNGVTLFLRNYFFLITIICLFCISSGFLFLLDIVLGLVKPLGSDWRSRDLTRCIYLVYSLIFLLSVALCRHSVDVDSSDKLLVQEFSRIIVIWRLILPLCVLLTFRLRRRFSLRISDLRSILLWGSRLRLGCLKYLRSLLHLLFTGW